MKPAFPNVPPYVTVERRKVRHARLRVFATGEVLMVVPQRLAARHVESIYAGKAGWVEEKRRMFANHSHVPVVEPDSPEALLLHGERYEVIVDETLGQRVLADHKRKIVASGVALTPGTVRELCYRSYARLYFADRVGVLARHHGYRFNRVYVRNQLTKWGNHSHLHNISLNWRLIKAPVHVSDYVILHELVHTIIPNHSAAYWSHLAGICPDFREAAEFLQSFH